MLLGEIINKTFNNNLQELLYAFSLHVQKNYLKVRIQVF